jgi:hypothetical protein
MADEKHSKRETGDDLEAGGDLEVGVTEDAAEQVKGAGQRVRGTVKWLTGETAYGLDTPPPAAPPTLPAQQ